MLKTLAMCLGLGAAGAMLAAALKWAGALKVPIEFLYGFYEQSPVFERIHGSVEFAAGQIALMVLAAVATAWVIAGIPHGARRLVIVLGAVLITIFLSPVLALIGWKLEPFSWLISIASAAISSTVVFPARNTSRDVNRDRDERKDSAAGAVPSSVPVRLVRTPEMALAAAEKAAATAATAASAGMAARNDQKSEGQLESGADVQDESDLRNEASIVMVEVFPGQMAVEGYSGAARAFLERAGTFLRSAGAADVEQGPDFTRAVFWPDKEARESHGHAKAASEAALLLKGHLLEFCNASDSDTIRVLRFGIAIESFTWNSSSTELPVLARDATRSLCLLNRRYGSRVVIGAHAHRFVGAAIEVRPLELMKDTDTGSPLEVYELLGEAGTLSDDDLFKRDAFWEGVVCLRSEQYNEAIERFQHARGDEDQDPVLEYFEAVSRGEHPEDDFPDEETDDDDAELIPTAYFRESDSEDRMETFIGDDDADDPVEAPVVQEKP